MVPTPPRSTRTYTLFPYTPLSRTGARGSWPAWAAKPVTFRTETLRRFANRVKAEGEALADLIARETGKPLGEARTEVESVANKVDISVKGYAERTAKRRNEGAEGLRNAGGPNPQGEHGRAHARTHGT